MTDPFENGVTCAAESNEFVR